MLPFVLHTHKDLCDAFFWDSCKALAALRLGRSKPAHAEWLFTVFVMDQLLAVGGTESEETSAARNAALLLLLSSERRPVAHSYLNALHIVFDEAVRRITDKCQTEAELIALQKDAFEAAPAYCEALSKAFAEERKSILSEIRAWQKRTFPGYSSPQIDAACSQARLISSELLFGRDIRNFNLLVRFLITFHAATISNRHVRQHGEFIPFVLAASLAITQAGQAMAKGRAIAFSDFEYADLCDLFSVTATASFFLLDVERGVYAAAASDVKKDEFAAGKALFADSDRFIEFASDNWMRRAEALIEKEP